MTELHGNVYIEIVDYCMFGLRIWAIVLLTAGFMTDWNSRVDMISSALCQSSRRPPWKVLPEDVSLGHTAGQKHQIGEARLGMVLTRTFIGRWRQSLILGMLTWVRWKDMSGHCCTIAGKVILQMHAQLYLSHSPLADTACAY